MRLTVLVDNNTIIDQYYYGEPAVSYYIEDGNNRILFDVGYSDLYLKNAEKMNINLDNLNFIVISHGHDDHTGGLQFYPDKTERNKKTVLLSHPDALKEKKLGELAIGSPLDLSELNKSFHCITSKNPYQLNDRWTFLGEIPRVFDFEISEPIGTISNQGQQVPDFLLDDSALVYHGKDGLFMFTGCSHSGICNITEYAKTICEDNRISGIIGGFHLPEMNARASGTIDYLQHQNISMLYPGHCASFTVQAELYQRMPVTPIGVSLQIEVF